MQNKPILPIILGPTASGKTALATAIAYKLQYEIISADSRQVYKGMTIGTGKDLSEYTVQGVQIPYHLIDIVDAGYMYNLFEFSQDFARAYTDILQRNKQALVCGGTGLYVESIIKQYTMVKVPEDADFRAACELRSFEDLKQEFLQYGKSHQGILWLQIYNSNPPRQGRGEYPFSNPDKKGRYRSGKYVFHHNPFASGIGWGKVCGYYHRRSPRSQQ